MLKIYIFIYTFYKYKPQSLALYFINSLQIDLIFYIVEKKLLARKGRIDLWHNDHTIVAIRLIRTTKTVNWLPIKKKL
jgi:hypothetical protein